MIFNKSKILFLGIAIIFNLSTIPALADTTISAAGSTALLPLVKDAADSYQNIHKDVKILVSGGGSGTGINQVDAKAIDIGDSDILAPTKPNLVDHKVAVIGFSIVAHPGIGVKSLTKKQIQDIFTGKITNWKQIGGVDEKIIVVNRTRGSGTRVVFEKTVMDDVPVSESSLSEDATGTVISVIRQTPGAISYAAFSGTKSQPIGSVYELQINGIEPTETNVITGMYPFWSYEHMFTNGPATSEVQKFIDYVSTNEILLKKNYFLKTNQMKVTENNR
jgi:phosphate transport system substrate-binding protein